MARGSTLDHTAIRGTSLSDRDHALLDVGKARAALVIEEVAYDQTGQPVIRATHRAVIDPFSYVNEIS